MKKENILKQIVLQEYGEKKHPKLTKNQFSLSSELYFELTKLIRQNEKHRFGKTKCDYFV